MEKLYSNKICEPLGKGVFYYLNFEEAYFENPKCESVHEYRDLVYKPIMVKENQIYYIDDGKIISYSLLKKSDPILVLNASNDITRCFVDSAKESYEHEVENMDSFSTDMPGHIMTCFLYYIYTCESEEERKAFYRDQLVGRLKNYNKDNIRGGYLSIECSDTDIKIFFNKKQITVQEMLELFVVKGHASEDRYNTDYKDYSNESYSYKSSNSESGGTGCGTIIVLAIILYLLIKYL